MGFTLNTFGVYGLRCRPYSFLHINQLIEQLEG